MKKFVSLFLCFILFFACSSTAFAYNSYTYVCSDCGETVEVEDGLDLHSFFCKGNASYCDNCGEIIYGSTIDYVAHVALCEFNKYEVKIKNNPGTTTLNYGDTLKLTAVVVYDGEILKGVPAEQYKWTADSNAVKITSFGSTCEIEAIKSGTVTITLNILDENGEELPWAIDEDGNEVGFVDTQTIKVKTGFFQMLASFFKNIFGINRTIVQNI